MMNIVKFTKVKKLIMCFGIFYLLSLDVYADTRRKQEIGEPYFDKSSGEGRVDSMALAPSGERIYTLKEGVLYEYGLSPLKKINSMKVEFDSKQTKDDPYRMFITNDEKRIIIYSKMRLRLLDLGSGKIIITKLIKSELGVLNDEEFLTLDNNNKGTVRDANNLKEKHVFTASGYDAWDHGKYANISHSNLIKAGDHLILYSEGVNPFPGEVTIFDKNSYKIIWKIYHRDDTRSAVSYDGKTLYVQNPLKEFKYLDKMYEHRNNYIKEHGAGLKDGQFPEVLKVDLAKGKWSYLTKKDFKYRFGLYVPLSKAGLSQKISPSYQYFLLGTNGRYGFLYSEEKRRRTKYFCQFQDGEAAFFGRIKSYFQITENARKHLRMKNSKGEIVPINDATFKKYNKANIDHKGW